MHSSHHSCMRGENPGTSQVWGNHLIGMRKIKWHNREKTIWRKKQCKDKQNTGTHTCRPLIYTQGDKKPHNNLRKLSWLPYIKMAIHLAEESLYQHIQPSPCLPQHGMVASTGPNIMWAVAAWKIHMRLPVGAPEQLVWWALAPTCLHGASVIGRHHC